MLQLRDHTFLGTTQSLCPECLSLVPAKIIAKHNRRVYFRKQCPTHGMREDFVCSDVRWYDRLEYMVPGKMPAEFGIEPDKGCPYDCGLCTEHEQHTCIALVELTSSCNLKCPMCYSSSGPGGTHLSFEEACRAIDRIVQTETRPEIIQLSGGEPTIHPEFERIFAYACEQPVDYVMINTNGIRFAHDEALVARIAERRKRTEIYFQFDGFTERTSRELRGESLVETKLRALDHLEKHGLHTILVTTLQAGVNDGEIGDIVRFAVGRPCITGVSFQPATYSGRHVLPEELERRITFPDVIKAVAAQTGLFEESDFMPLPCAHPNCHSLTYAYRHGSTVIPLTRFIDPKDSIDLLANGITFTRPRARQLIETYLSKLNLGCCAGGNCDTGPALVSLESLLPQGGRGATEGSHSDRSGLAESNGHEANSDSAAQQFFAKALAENLSPRDVFRITITSFLDAYNFDIRRLMKCCVHHTLPSGHVIPFCAYNVLYREGHVALPALTRALQEGGIGAASAVEATSP
jgi:7,8-dihydro-6-hydroxymethylpterin dimethyltransferase